MKVDMHIHTYFSDGTLSPESMVKKAYDNNVRIIAVCDHHTVDAFERTQAACMNYNITLIKGVEIDCSYEKGDQHVLAFGFDDKNEALLSLLNENIDLFDEQDIELIGKMNIDYPDLSIEEFATYNRVLENGGWKGIDYLKSKGFNVSFPDCMDFYKKYKCTFKKPFRHIKEVCNIIKKSGGVSVLAHPRDRLGANNLLENLSEIREYGIDGVECYYPSHSQDVTDQCVDFCNKHGMLITAGGDEHGDFAKFIDGVTYGIETIDIDDSLLNIKCLLRNACE